MFEYEKAIAKHCRSQKTIGRIEAYKAMKNGCNLLEVEEQRAKKEAIKEFAKNVEYGKSYYLRIDRNIFNDEHSAHVEADLQYKEATPWEEALEETTDRTVRFYDAFKGLVYRCSNKYAEECRGLPAEKELDGYSVTLHVEVPRGANLDNVMRNLAIEWEKEARGDRVGEGQEN